jgi:hypothetical protein
MSTFKSTRAVTLCILLVIFALSMAPPDSAQAIDQGPPVIADPWDTVCDFVGPHDCPPSTTIELEAISEAVVGIDPSTPGGITSDDDYWVIQWSMGWAWRSYTGDSRGMRHRFARTIKKEGSGSYVAEAHAALVHGGSYTDEIVFSMDTDSCAVSEVSNSSAGTCPSNWFDSHVGDNWIVVSGHYFDVGEDGSRDATCDGCLDRGFTMP